MPATESHSIQRQLRPREPAVVFERSKDLWTRLTELSPRSQAGWLPAWAYDSISEIRAALGDEFEHLFAAQPERLVVRIGVSDPDGELMITFTQPGTWHAEAIENGIPAGEVVAEAFLDVSAGKHLLDADALTRAKQGLERIKSIRI